MLDFDGRVVLVTGASRNIGRAIALGFAKGGAKVIVHAHQDVDSAEKTADLVERAGGKAVVLTADLSDPAAPEALVARSLAAAGRLDVLVANAAVRLHNRVEDISYSEWRAVMSLALDSVFLLAKAAAPALKASERGALITIGGMTAHSGASERAHVVAAKAGLAGLTRALAHEWGPDGVTVNCVAPGLVDTLRQGAAPAHHAHSRNVLARFGQPEEIAGAVVSLAGPALRYVTGQVIHVNGGGWMG